MSASMDEMRCGGVFADSLTHEQLFRGFAQANGGTTITPTQALRALSVLQLGIPEEKIAFVLQVADLDNSGDISLEEFLALVPVLLDLRGLYKRRRRLRENALGLRRPFEPGGRCGMHAYTLKI